ncbi:MAG: hypothetical protein HY760_00600, partial [Nitrospirae bacterium]|nr:hypothetical protein [Nitrospirota bacterium]
MVPRLSGILLLAILFFSPPVWGSSPSFQEFLRSEEAAGRLDHETTLLYQIYAIKDPVRLPEPFRSILEDSPPLQEGTLIFREVQRRWWEWTPEFRIQVSPFFLSSPQSPSPRFPNKGAYLNKSLLSGVHRMAHWAQTANFNFEWGDNIDPRNTAPCGASVRFTDSDSGSDPCPPISDLVKRWAEYFETSWAKIVDRMGYRAPEYAAAGLIDVFIANTGCGGDWCALSSRILGLTVTYCGSALECQGEDANAAYILINKSFQSNVTAAHEFFHVIQFSYDRDDQWYERDGWWLEATATWMEDRVFDETNDYYSVIRKWALEPQVSLQNSGNGHAYGSALFPFYLAETLGEEIVREIWEDPAFNGIDGIQTIDAVLRKRGSDLNSVFKDFTARNAVMDAYYEEGSQYGKVALRETHAIYPAASSESLNTEAPLGIYGSQYIRFLPPDGEDHLLTLSFDGFDGASWGAMVVAVKKGGGYVPEEIGLTSLGQAGCLSISGFGSIYEGIYLVPSLLSQLPLGTVSLYRYEAQLNGTCQESLSQEASPASGVVRSGGDKRCFIATAAYGSFEDP